MSDIERRNLDILEQHFQMMQTRLYPEAWRRDMSILSSMRTLAPA